MVRLGFAVVAGTLLVVVSGCGSTSASKQATATTAPPSTTAANPVEALISKTKSGIIRITTATCDGGEIGTGFLLSPRLVATVEHVVDGAQQIKLSRNGKGLGSATVIGADPARDLALLRTKEPITGYDFAFADRSPALGEDVVALGFPLGLPLTVTKGSVSGLGRTIPIDNVNRRQLVQTDAAVNPGNSGGPLLATDTGKVLGLVDLRTSGANGIAFAVSAGVASPLLKAWQVAPQPTEAVYCGDLGTNIGTPTTPSTVSDEVTYARAVAHVLENSAAVRKQLVAAVSEASTNQAAAQQALALVVAARRDELDAASNAAVPSGAEQTQAAFVRAFQLSLTSDLLYQRWIDAGSSAALARAQANDQLAVAAKARFMTLYDNLRSDAGLPPFPQDFPF